MSEQPQHTRLVELTPREVALLLKYGYPWPEVAAQLNASEAVSGYHRLPIREYWIEMMSADVVRSAKKIQSAQLLEELDGLFAALQSALRSDPLIGARS